MNHGKGRPVHTHRYTLPLYGRAGLYREGQALRVPSRALFILYYLALEGSTSRAFLAELLWGHKAASQNLRAELLRLKRAVGEALFAPGQDPLTLPPWVQLEERGEGEALEGLEALGGEAEAWVLLQRSRLARARFWSPPDLEGLLGGLLDLTPPFLLVLRGEPGSGRHTLAQALAQRLGLPYREGLGPGPALRLLEEPYPKEVDRVLRDRSSIYVVLMDFGEDPLFLLELRSRYPPERTRVLELPLLAWDRARGSLLKGLPFPRAAQVYLASGGNPGLMREILACDRLVPQVARAQVQLLARRLSLPARQALERLALQKGRIPPPLLEAFEALPHLEEMERKGFLAYRDGWAFAREHLRRLLASGLPPGMKHDLHRKALGLLEARGYAREAAYHRLMLGEEVEWTAFPPWPAAEVGLGPGVYYLEVERSPGILGGPEGFALAQTEPGAEAFLVLEAVAGEVLALEGEAYWEEPVYGLKLVLGDQEIPLPPRFAWRFRLPGEAFLTLGFRGQGVAEFKVRLHRRGRSQARAFLLSAGKGSRARLKGGSKEGPR